MPSEPVVPVLHPIEQVSDDISAGEHESLRIRETIAALASQRCWKHLWQIADKMSKEVSILFDYTGRSWVDIGTSGQVRLSPPKGARIPFRLWIHTHPWNAYWSSTDLQTLASSSMILNEALVLGHDHFKRTRKEEKGTESLSSQGPLSVWSSEPCQPYPNLESQRGEEGG